MQCLLYGIFDYSLLYRETLLNNVREGRYFIEIDLEDLRNDRPKLHQAVLSHPNDYIPVVRIENFTILQKKALKFKNQRIIVVSFLLLLFSFLCIIFIDGIRYTGCCDRLSSK